MKTILTILAVLTFTSAAMAHDGQNPRHPRRPGQRKMSVTVVKGKKAQAIFEALDADVVTVNRPKFSVDAKKVAGLKCVKATKKDDTSVTKFRCALKGKSARAGRRGQRHPRRGGRGNGHGRGHDHGQNGQTSDLLLNL